MSDNCMSPKPNNTRVKFCQTSPTEGGDSFIYHIFVKKKESMQKKKTCIKYTTNHENFELRIKSCPNI